MLAILLGLSDPPSLFNPTPDGEVGPPLVVLVATSVCGLMLTPARTARSTQEVAS